MSETSKAAAATPNLFATIQAVRANELERQGKQAQISKVLQELSQAPLERDLKERQFKLDTRKVDISEDANNPVKQLQQIAQYAAMTGNTELLGNIANMLGSQMQPNGVQSDADKTGIPNYLGISSPTTSGPNVQIKGGKVSIGTGSNKLDEVQKANLDIAKSQKTSQIKDEAKDKKLSESSMKQLNRLTQRYGASLEELRGFDPEIGRKGVGGAISRGIASLGTKVDEFPRTKAFEVEKLPLANMTARMIEGGKITDSDRKIYADAMISALSNPDETNSTLLANQIIDLVDKYGVDGADPSKLMKYFESTNIDVFKRVAEIVYENAPEVKMKVLGYDPNEYEVVS